MSPRTTSSTPFALARSYAIARPSSRPEHQRLTFAPLQCPYIVTDYFPFSLQLSIVVGDAEDVPGLIRGGDELHYVQELVGNPAAREMFEPMTMERGTPTGLSLGTSESRM